MKTLVVYCHPTADSFAMAARDAAVAGLRAGGHDVRSTDLYREGFNPVLSQSEHAAHLATGRIEADISKHVDDLRWCQQLVLVYPTWWSGQPAMLKGWIDRVLVRGIAWDLPSGGNRISGLLHNVCRITVVTSHGSTKLINALEGEAGKRTVTRSLRGLCGLRCRTRWIALYNIDRAEEAARTAFLRRVTRRLQR